MMMLCFADGGIREGKFVKESPGYSLFKSVLSVTGFKITITRLHLIAAICAVYIANGA